MQKQTNKKLHQSWSSNRQDVGGVRVGGRWAASRGLPDGQTSAPLSIPCGLPWHREEMGTQGPVATGVPPGRYSCHRPHLRPLCGQASALAGPALPAETISVRCSGFKDPNPSQLGLPRKGPSGLGWHEARPCWSCAGPRDYWPLCGQSCPPGEIDPFHGNTETQAHVPAGHSAGRTQLILSSHWPPLRY